MTEKTSDKPAKAEKVTIGGVELSQKEVEDARREGALETIREGGRAAVLADTGTQVDIQRMARQVHVQTYHLVASASLVLRTQTIFEHA